ncbi:hypothetical protein BBP40_005312 [Aspergillus hancockii]|nr:hypothetical protein BBP40_005312 [Aspergillus hancockii]
MVYLPSRNLLITIFRSALNIFIHSTGDGPILARVHKLLDWQLVGTSSYTCLIPIALSIILNALVRYVLGHVMVSMLILESAGTHEPISSETGMKRIPSSRRIIKTLYSLYRSGGIRFLFSGLRVAITYWIARALTTHLLQTLAFRHAYLRPFAYVSSCLLLAETHLYWTACTILASAAQKKQLSRRHDRTRWKSLAIPTLIYATAEVATSHISGGMNLLILSAEENASVDSTKVILSDILVSLLMLVIQFLVLLPSHIALISIEGSFLPKAFETILPSHRQRGTRIAELFPAGNLPLEPQRVNKMIRLARWLWLIELHAKMCLCLFCVQIVTHFLVYCLR